MKSTKPNVCYSLEMDCSPHGALNVITAPEELGPKAIISLLNLALPTTQARQGDAPSHVEVWPRLSDDDIGQFIRNNCERGVDVMLSTPLDARDRFAGALATSQELAAA